MILTPHILTIYTNEKNTFDLVVDGTGQIKNRRRNQFETAMPLIGRIQDILISQSCPCPNLWKLEINFLSGSGKSGCRWN